MATKAFAVCVLSALAAFSHSAEIESAESFFAWAREQASETTSWQADASLHVGGRMGFDMDGEVWAAKSQLAFDFAYEYERGYPGGEPPKTVSATFAGMLDPDGVLWRKEVRSIEDDETSESVAKMDLAALEDDLGPARGLNALFMQPPAILLALCQSQNELLDFLEDIFEVQFHGASSDTYALGGNVRTDLAPPFVRDGHVMAGVLGFNKFEATFGKEDGLLRSLTLRHTKGGESDTLRVAFSNLQRNVSISEETFALDYDVEPQDETEMVRNAVAEVRDGIRARGLNYGVGDPAPELVLPIFAPGEETLSVPGDLEGKVFFIDFWATWCGPCLAAMPDLAEVYREYKDDGFEVVGLSTDSDEEAMAEFLEENPEYDWIQTIVNASTHGEERLYDGRISADYMRLMAKVGVNALPTTFLVDRNGIIQGVNLHGDELAEKVAELVSQSPGA